jgi:DNA-binding GntR family transcriptional regulator
VNPLVNSPALGAVGTRRNLREEISQTLRAAVISGELRPGVVYSAPSLATQFGVSATPVREAMLDLAKEGLIDVVRNKGFRVTELSEKDLDELSELRALIEVPTVGRIAESGIPPEVADRLRSLGEGIEQAATDRDLITHVALDLEFHLTLLGLAGNSHLVETVRTLRSRSRLYGLRSLAERDALVPSSREHVELVDLIVAGEAATAKRLMNRHIRHVRGIWAEGSPAHIPR